LIKSALNQLSSKEKGEKKRKEKIASSILIFFPVLAILLTNISLTGGFLV